MIQRNEPLTETRLSRHVAVSPKPHASTSVEHDTPDSMGSYIPNAPAIEAIKKFTAGIGSGSALSITGPYGSGKSTFGVVMSHLAAPLADPGWKAAYGSIRNASPETASELATHRKAAGIHTTGMIRCVATARLEPATATLLRAADRGARSFFGPSYKDRHFGEAGTLRQCARNLLKGTVPDAATVARVIASMASACPVLLIVDEFGKNIEYFATGGSDGDLFLLQELAEMSGASRAVRLHITTMQHMAFGEYTTGALAGRMREWAKIQGRFDDVHFANSLEHTRSMISSCIKPDARASRAIREWASTEARTAAEEAGLDISADLAASCYPLQPLAVEALPELCSRYGQNDRTLLSFVAGGGPGTVTRFVETTSWGGKEMPSVGMDALYDYFIASHTANRSGAGDASRIVEIGTIIRDAGDLPPLETAVLKAIGLMNLVGRSGRLRASMGAIRCSAGLGAEQAVKSLEARSLITYRRHADEYRIWHGTDVNIAAKIDAWRNAGRQMPFAALMGATMKPEPVVAARHAAETGTLRVFRCSFEGQAFDLEPEYDGAVVYGTSDARIPACDRPVVVARCRDVSDLREAAVEVLALRAVMEDEEVKADWVASGEVAERLAAAENALEAAFDGAYGAKTSWSYGTTTPESIISGPASAAASQACGAAYSGSPRIRNEMINRNRLTAQGSMALNKIMAAVINNADKPLLGIRGWGPERAIYETVIGECRAHGKRGRSWRILKSLGNLAPVRKAALERLRHSRNAVPISEIFDVWRAPPLGIKRGVMPLLILLVIVSAQAKLALYEHGSYVPRVNASLAERLVKNPQHFALKYFQRTATRSELVQKTAKALKVDPARGALGIVVRIVGAVRALPAYTKRTESLGKRTRAVRDAIQSAVEPDTLLFESMPAALGLGVSGRNVKGIDVQAFAAGLAAAIADLETAFDSMRRGMLNSLLAETKAPDRTSLAKTATSLFPSVSDQRMKVFLGAIAAGIPDDMEWVSYVALALTNRTPSEWRDEHLRMFENSLREAASGYLRLAELRFGDVSGSLKEPSVMVTITRPDGREERTILPADDPRIARLESGQ